MKLDDLRRLADLSTLSDGAETLTSLDGRKFSGTSSKFLRITAVWHSPVPEVLG
jgi:hypothetical protein